MICRRAIVLVLVLAALAGLFVISAPGASAQPDKFALVIGIARFQGRTAALPGADGDARDTSQFLVNNGWSSENVRTLVNYQASAAAILDGLQWLASKCVPGTSCVFKYSGHVKLTRSTAERDRTNENLWTSENSFISDDQVAKYLQQLHGRAWIDISGCEAAGFDDNVSNSRRVVTASSQENQKSYESPVYKNSVWTELLVNQGLAQGKNLSDAFHSAKERAFKETQGQKSGPQTAYMAGGDPQSWFNRAPAPGARQAPSCLLNLICL